jgi:hypothetical protein
MLKTIQEKCELQNVQPFIIIIEKNQTLEKGKLRTQNHHLKTKYY